MFTPRIAKLFLFFGTVFHPVSETLQMQTVREQARIFDMSASAFSSSPRVISEPDSALKLGTSQKRLKMSEFRSWACCFAVVAGLTGLIKFLKVGVTMESVNSPLFYISLIGFIYFISRILMISRLKTHTGLTTATELN